jgi:hypothetical protein
VRAEALVTVIEQPLNEASNGAREVPARES